MEKLLEQSECGGVSGNQGGANSVNQVDGDSDDTHLLALWGEVGECLRKGTMASASTFAWRTYVPGFFQGAFPVLELSESK